MLLAPQVLAQFDFAISNGPTRSGKLIPMALLGEMKHEAICCQSDTGGGRKMASPFNLVDGGDDLFGLVIIYEY